MLGGLITRKHGFTLSWQQSEVRCSLCLRSIWETCAGLDYSSFLTSLFDPLAFLELVWFVVMWQRNSIAVFIAQNSTRVSNISYGQLLIRQKGHQTCSAWNTRRADKNAKGKCQSLKMRGRKWIKILWFSWRSTVEHFLSKHPAKMSGITRCLSSGNRKCLQNFKGVHQIPAKMFPSQPNWGRNLKWHDIPLRNKPQCLAVNTFFLTITWWQIT